MSTAVVSAKGGVGKSSFCVFAGRTLSQHGRETLLIDMDVGVRSLDLLLGVAEKTMYNWGDVLSGNCDVKKAVINVAPHLYLLAAPLSYPENCTKEDFKSLVLSLEKDFEFILIDSPAGIERGFTFSAFSCESCIVVSTQDPISIRAAGNAAALVRTFGIKNIRLVLNRFDKKSKTGICIDDLVDEVGARLLGVVPEDRNIRAASFGKELPYDSKASLAFVRIAGRMCGENIPFRIKNL